MLCLEIMGGQSGLTAACVQVVVKPCVCPDENIDDNWREEGEHTCSKSLWMTEMYHPFSVSSTLQKPSRPRYLTYSVSVNHFVEFM